MIRIYQFGEVSKDEIFARNDAMPDVSGKVQAIIADVVERGDAAVKEYTAKFDGAVLDDLQVSDREIEEAFAAVEPSFIEILKRAERNITKFHEKQVRASFIINDEDGVVMGQKVLPIEKVGIYVPAGTAPLSSTVLMDSIPARIAGCSEIVMVTPPGKDGKINPAMLAAAKIAGVNRIFKMGGAQAIAALAYGTESVPKVDKIVGPGNAFVAEAKRQVFGRVAIDMIAGPSEILIVSDGKTSPKCLAADMLSQAEHDRNASAVLVTDSMDTAKAVQKELEAQLETLPRRDIARASIDNNSKIIVTDDLLSAIDVSNEIAPEHLELCVDDPFAILSRVKNAGSVFMGRNCPEALGDYMAGPNHTLPTSGTAKFSSPLSVDDFVKKTQYTYFTESALNALADDVAAFARMEQLEAHARSAESRK
ncbi:MAG: histidinol dehydrogenase [Clostridiales bacterium]|nr:histidinol dehydrogenase [Clostridiales bacterium]